MPLCTFLKNKHFRRFSTSCLVNFLNSKNMDTFQEKVVNRTHRTTVVLKFVTRLSDVKNHTPPTPHTIFEIIDIFYVYGIVLIN